MLGLASIGNVHWRRQISASQHPRAWLAIEVRSCTAKVSDMCDWQEEVCGCRSPSWVSCMLSRLGWFPATCACPMSSAIPACPFASKRACKCCTADCRVLPLAWCQQKPRSSHGPVLGADQCIRGQGRRGRPGGLSVHPLAAGCRGAVQHDGHGPQPQQPPPQAAA